MKTLKYRCQQPTLDLLQGKQYRFVDNGSKVLAIAHCDSIDCGTNHFNQKGNLVYNTSLDDRLGIHIILDVLPNMGIVPDILLTDDEEIGRSTAQLFDVYKSYNWMFQFDRKGTDAVCYEFLRMEPYIEKYFKLGWGTFSDICWLEHLGCCGLNVGTGYYKEHTKESYADLHHTATQIYKFAKFWHSFYDVYIEHKMNDKWYNKLLIEEGWIHK